MRWNAHAPLQPFAHRAFRPRPSTSLLLVPPALAETEEAALALPSQLVSVRQDPAELDHIDLATPVSAGSRLGLSALDTPASTSSISGEEVRRRNNPSVQAAVTRSPGISFIGTPEMAVPASRRAASAAMHR